MAATEHSGTFVYTDLDFNSISKIINIPDATEDRSPVTYQQLIAFAQGLKWKDSVQIDTSGPITLASPGAVINGRTMVNGDRVLVRAQVDAKTNGIYIWTGPSVALTRSTDMDVSAEFNNAVVTVDVKAGDPAGSAGITFRQITVNPVLGEDDMVFTLFGTGTPTATETLGGIVELATQSEVDIGSDTTRVITPATLTSWSGRILKYTTPFGDAGNTQYTINHNLGTQDVVVSVYKNASPYSQVIVDVEHTDINNITVKFSSAPGLNSFKVVVMGQIDPPV